MNWFLRTILRLYPRSFRDDYGAEMLEQFAARASRVKGWRASAGVAIAAVADALPNAARLHGELLARDLHHTLRVARRSPVFFAGLVAVLALGIGANASVFTVLQAVLLQPLPYRDPENVVMLWDGPERPDPALSRADAQRRLHGPLTRVNIVKWREGTRDVLAGLAAVRSWTGNLDAQFDLEFAAHTERLRGALVTPNFFDVLGVEPHLGRVFTESDDTGAALVVISHGLWQRAFGGASSIVGRTLLLTGGSPRERRPYVIVGVLPRNFRFTYPEETEAWVLESWHDLARFPARASAFWAVGRLQGDATLASAQARLSSFAEIPPGMPPNAPRWVPRVEPMREWVVGNARPSLALLGGTAFLLFVIACATVASALLTRVAATQRELAVRASLGANVARLRRALVTQGAAVSIAGALAGTAIAAGVVPVLRALVPTAFPRADELGVNWWMLAFAAIAAGLTTVLATLVPAWHARTASPALALKNESAGAGTDRATARWRTSVIATQSAIATVLLVAGSLFAMSLWQLGRVSLGFEARDVLTVEMRLLGGQFRNPETVAALQRDLVREVGAVPGVTEVGLTSAVPFRGVDYLGSVARADDTVTTIAHHRYADSAFFSIMRISLAAGRMFSGADTPGSQPVAIVSEQLATNLFGSTAVLGRRIEIDTIRTIVGVVHDVRYRSFDQNAQPAAYIPQSQAPENLLCIVIRVAPGVTDIAQPILAAIHRANPGVPAMKFTSIGQILSESVSARRFYTVATVAFAIIAAALTFTGIAIIVSRAVIERRRELAIRSALGATSRALLQLIVQQGLAPVCVGVMIGTAVVIAGQRVLDAFLFGVRAADPTAHAAIAAVLIGAGAIASLVPALRVLRTAPADVLRAE